MVKDKNGELLWIWTDKLQIMNNNLADLEHEG
jgi:hypothetical protein